METALRARERKASMSLYRFEHQVVVAELSDNAFTVACRMRDLGVGSVVIVRDQRPIGIVTDRDLCIRVIAEGKHPETTLVSEVVTYDATTLTRSAGIDTAVRTMREKGVRRLPIVDEEGRITGIVTADDLFVLLTSELADLGELLDNNVDSVESR